VEPEMLTSKFSILHNAGFKVQYSSLCLEQCSVGSVEIEQSTSKHYGPQALSVGIADGFSSGH
jgi:hypothetical protein